MTGITGDRDGLRAVAENRAQAYWLAAGFFVTPPDQGMVDGVTAQLGGLDGSAASEVPPVARRLADALDGVDLDSLGVEYTRLFCGIREGYGPPPPYESLYREGTLMGDSTQRVLGMYAAAGFGMIDEAIAPQDHIGAELKFMALLCFEEAGALARQDDDAVERLRGHQAAFMDDHLAVWLPDYCRRIEAESREPFYAAAAALTANILAADRQVLAEYGGDRPAEAGYSAASS